MNKQIFKQIQWILATAIFSFVISAIFSSLFHLPRSVYLIFYVTFAVPFFYCFVKYNQINIRKTLRHNWCWGLLVAVLLGLFMIKNIYSQPASAHPEGWTLALDILWLGVVYGFIDALLLSVIPAVAVWNMGLNTSFKGKILAGILIIMASIFITSAYHLGYEEYRNKRIVSPIVGNSIMTLGYVVSGNPISATLSHVAMHIAGVMRGAESVVQLPPHYK